MQRPLLRNRLLSRAIVWPLWTSSVAVRAETAVIWASLALDCSSNSRSIDGPESSSWTESGKIKSRLARDKCELQLALMISRQLARIVIVVVVAVVVTRHEVAARNWPEAALAFKFTFAASNSSGL